MIGFTVTVLLYTWLYHISLKHNALRPDENIVVIAESVRLSTIKLATAQYMSQQLEANFLVFEQFEIIDVLMEIQKSTDSVSF